MKNVLETFGIIALVAIIGFSMAGCKNDDDGGDPKPQTGGGLSAPTGLRAMAFSSSGIAVNWNSVPGATGYKVYNGRTPEVAFVGNVDSNSGYNNNLPANTTVYYRVSAYNSSGEGPMSSVASATTLSSGNYSLNGVWKAANNDWQITVSTNSSGVSTGVISVISGSFGVIWDDAVNKGYVKVGTHLWENFRNTGNLTWSGDILGITHGSNPNVATGTGWYNNCTLTMSADGQKVTDVGSGVIWTRQ